MDFEEITMKWFLYYLTLLLIALKLTGFVIASWWLVLSPIWVPFVILFMSLGILTALKIWTER